MGKQWKQWETLFSWAPKSLQMVTAAMKLKTLAPWKKGYHQHSILKSRDMTLPTKINRVKPMVFPIAKYECESWTIKKAEHQRTDAFKLWCWRRPFESPLNYKINPVNPKGNKSWIFIGRTDAKAETPILWPPGVKSRLIAKHPDAGKDWGQKD